VYLLYNYISSVYFFHHPATPEIYTLSLHDALPISPTRARSSRRSTGSSRPGSGPRTSPAGCSGSPARAAPTASGATSPGSSRRRSEEHTSELQSRGHLVCRLLLEKKKFQRLHFLI